MTSVKRSIHIAAMCVLLAATTVASAQAPRVSVSLDLSAATVQNGLADVTFAVTVSNEESVALSDAWVVLADNTEIAVGDVPAEGSASSESTTHTFDVSSTPSHNTPIDVTLKYSVNGVPQEQATTVVLRIPS